MICWDWSHHLCSCYLDAFLFLWLPWWDGPCIWFLWKGVWYLVTWWCGQDWSCVQLLLICQAGPIWYVSHILLSAHGRTVRSVRCTPCRIHRESCIISLHTTYSLPCDFMTWGWPTAAETCHHNKLSKIQLFWSAHPSLISKQVRKCASQTLLIAPLRSH